MRLIRINDCNWEPGSDMLFAIPEDMENETAVRVVDETIRKLIEGWPTSYTRERLESELAEHGIVQPTIVTANERW